MLERVIEPGLYLSCMAWLGRSDDNQTDKSTLPSLKEESNDKYQIEKK